MVTCLLTMLYCLWTIAKGNNPVQPFPRPMETNIPVIPVYMQLYAYWHYWNGRQFSLFPCKAAVILSLLFPPRPLSIFNNESFKLLSVHTWESIEQNWNFAWELFCCRWPFCGNKHCCVSPNFPFAPQKSPPEPDRTRVSHISKWEKNWEKKLFLKNHLPLLKS